MAGFINDEQKYSANTYSRQPILIIEASGSTVKDSSGKAYIDCFSGIAVNNVGHTHPKVVEAVKNQTAKLMHTSNIFYTRPQIDLAKKLSNITGGYKSFLCNSGAEANEAAIKLVRKFTGKPEIIAAENSFHGRTLATLAATGQERYKKGFAPMPEGFRHVSYGDVKAVKKAVTGKTAAVMLEPVQGEAGVVVPPEGYLSEVAAICKEKGVLFVLDEVQTGFGRTGEMFAWQGEDIQPDIFTLAKALGGGLPIGAMMAKEEVMTAFGPGDHASTFGGNPVTCAAASAAIDVITGEGLVKRSREMGTYLGKGLRDLKAKHSIIKEVRGRGLMIGVELSIKGSKIVERAREKGILLNCIHDNVLRFTPPLVIKKEEIDTILKVLDLVLLEAV